MSDNKKTGKLATYSVIMILMIIIVIIFAAMADNREEVFQSQINETSKTNVEIQNELVIVKDENESLKKEVETLKAKETEFSKKSEITDKLSEVWSIFESGNISEAKSKFSEIDTDSIPESLSTFYSAINNCLN